MIIYRTKKTNRQRYDVGEMADWIMENEELDAWGQDSFVTHPDPDVEAWPYVWYWRCKLPERKGQKCKVTARGKMNSIRVEFPDGYVVITSRYAVRTRT